MTIQWQPTYGRAFAKAIETSTLEFDTLALFQDAIDGSEVDNYDVAFITSDDEWAANLDGTAILISDIDTTGGGDLIINDLEEEQLFGGVFAWRAREGEVYGFGDPPSAAEPGFDIGSGIIDAMVPFELGTGYLRNTRGRDLLWDPGGNAPSFETVDGDTWLQFYEVFGGTDESFTVPGSGRTFDKFFLEGPRSWAIIFEYEYTPNVGEKGGLELFSCSDGPNGFSIEVIEADWSTNDVQISCNAHQAGGFTLEADVSAGRHFVIIERPPGEPATIKIDAVGAVGSSSATSSRTNPSADFVFLGNNWLDTSETFNFGGFVLLVHNGSSAISESVMQKWVDWLQDRSPL
jgi:hypothetical protein